MSALPATYRRVGNWRAWRAAFVAAYLFWSMWFYFDHILAPYQVTYDLRTDRPRGNLSDLYARWLGSRELFLHGRDPYSEEVTREIQQGYYGRELSAARPEDPIDKQAFAYPVYVAFFFWPVVHLPFRTIQPYFFYLSAFCSLISVWLWLFSMRWRPSLAVMLTLSFLFMGSMAVVQGLKVQNPSLVVGFFMAAALAALVGGWPVIAGILLSLASIKPQMSVIVTAWLMLWVFRDWRARQRLFWSLSASLTVLFAGAWMLLPGWLGKFIVAARDYQQYTRQESIPGLLSGNVLGNSLPGLVFVGSSVLLVSWLLWPLLKFPAGSAQFTASLALSTLFTILIIPMVSLYNQVLLLPSIVLLSSQAVSFWKGRPLPRMIYGVSVGLLLWPWLITAVLYPLAHLLKPSLVQRAWTLPYETCLTLPPVLFLLTALVVYRYRSAAKLGSEAVETSVAI